ncbi:uncharacterized protein A1O9_04700 [Exophiala aquamarina CBS 119918]|uniref:Major facilitator superfamily (MFS) profile domain-containing protein n=1 Tax=Exophiala aquamarina CBS 119918 TaxID=1182545 RepID=A0A072PJE8_9EURO|nr:uncharacterized protein A1O9_04700 [Exophiala aquamarina CBS 119918]KEF59852.1 hypothetical protein A1O9_04700 [Exophiala aquamarina CBS 119918]
MLGNMFAAGISPLFGPIIKEFHVPISQVSWLSSYALLTLGLSNLFSIVLYRYIGKRLTILTTLVGFLGCNIWTVYTTSYNSLVATRVVGGLFSGVIESLGPEIIVETFQEKELASAMAVYVGFLAAGSALGPIFAGVIETQTREWRWFFKFLAIIIGFNLLASILMLPETTTRGVAPSYTRHITEDNVDSKQDTTSEKVEFSVLPPVSAEQRPPQSHQFWQVWVEKSFHLRLSDLPPRQESALQYLYRPFFMLQYPSVLITIIIFGLTIGWTVATSIVLSNVFQSPPLLWTARAVGLLNIAPLIGLVVGLPVGGLLADWRAYHTRQRNAGVHVPESRLVVVILGAVISPAGVLIIGLSMQNHTHWLGPAFGWALLAFGLTGSANVLLSYTIDSYPHKAAHTALLVNVVKNVLGFCVSFESMDWFLRDGAAKQFGAMAGALWASYVFVIPLYIYGMKLRERSWTWF